MEADQESEADPANLPTLRLQATSFPTYAAPTFSPSSKVDEGYSDDTRSQSEKEPMMDSTVILPDWMLAQSEPDRAGKYPSYSFQVRGFKKTSSPPWTFSAR